MSLARSTSRCRHLWDRFEAIVGLIAMFMLSFGPPAVAGLMLIVALLTQQWPEAGGCALITGLTGPMAIWLAKMAGAAVEKFLGRSPRRAIRVVSADGMKDLQYEREVPFALLMVAELPRLPLIARLPLAFWWFAHFAAASAIVIVTHLPLRRGIQAQGLVAGVATVAICFLFTFAANVFLLLAVTIGFWSPAITARVWRYRFLIDVLLIFPPLLGIVF